MLNQLNTPKRMLVNNSEKFLFITFVTLQSLFVASCTIIPKFNFDTIDISKERDHLRELQASEKEPKVFDGELEPRMPDDDENDKTVLGIDSNNNGIRDDVEIYINRRFNEADFRKAYKQYAKAHQKWMILGEQKADSATLKKFLGGERNKANNCVLSGLFGYASEAFARERRISDEILSFMVGATRKRKAAYKNGWDRIGAGVIEYEDGTTEQDCDFKLEKKWY